MFKTLKSKILAFFSLGAIAATNAAAKVTMDNTGVVSGDFEMGTFYGLAVAVLAALGAMWIVKRSISLVK